MLPQVPQFTAAGVVNAFSYAQPVSPGSLVSLFGTDLATAAASATSIPLPLKLGGTSVTVNGVNAPLLFVSPRQINFQLPSVVGTQDSAYVTTASVVITTPAGSSEAVEAPVFASGPAIATSTQNGCGQAAALNVARDGTVSLNSPTNSAARGDYISLYGTGLGVSIAQPPDGTALPYGLGVEFEPAVWLDGYIATVVPLPALRRTLLALIRSTFRSLNMLGKDVQSPSQLKQAL